MTEGRYWTGTSWVTAEEMMRLRQTLNPDVQPQKPNPVPRQKEPENDGRQPDKRPDHHDN